MEIEEIVITIGKDGKVEISVSGVKGMACLDLTRALEEALGGEVLMREMKPEAYETSSTEPDQTVTFNNGK
jgi:hypothetical protein